MYKAELIEIILWFLILLLISRKLRKCIDVVMSKLFCTYVLYICKNKGAFLQHYCGALFAFCCLYNEIIQNFKPLASCCSWEDLFVTDLETLKTGFLMWCPYGRFQFLFSINVLNIILVIKICTVTCMHFCCLFGHYWDSAR